MKRGGFIKKKTRNITVCGVDCAYLCIVEDKFELTISPKANKNNRMKIQFVSPVPTKPTQHTWAFFTLSAKKDNTPTIFHLALPYGISILTEHLIKNKTWDCSLPKGMQIINGFTLLEEMQYTDIVPNWIQIF